jgi:hypothetical protein
MLYFDALKELFLGQHFIKYHACSPDITPLRVTLVVFVEVDLWTCV